MEIPLTVIHNRISIRQAGLRGYNDYFQSIALNRDLKKKNLFFEKVVKFCQFRPLKPFSRWKKMVVREPLVMKSPVKA